MLKWLRDRAAQFDVVALVEANGWDAGTGRARRAAAAAVPLDDNDDVDAATPTSAYDATDVTAAAAAAAAVSSSGASSNTSSSIVASRRALLRNQPRHRAAQQQQRQPPLPAPLSSPPAFMRGTTAAFLKRAASIGYPFAHLLAIPSGYHIALLSTAPISVIMDGSGVRPSSSHSDGLFERGMLVADTHGVRWMIAHLNAHNPQPRRDEAAWIAHLGREFNAGGIPTVVAGDFNTLSPLDAACHAASGIAEWLNNPSVQHYQRTKWRIAAGDDTHTTTVGGGGSPCVVDYRPLGALLAPTPAAAASNFSFYEGRCSVPFLGPFFDCVVPEGPLSTRDSSSGAACARIGSIPTAFDVDPVGLVEPPLRIDHVLANGAMQGAWRAPSPPPPRAGASAAVVPALAGAACTVQSFDADAAGISDHFPVACEWEWRARGAV